jgi:hypothetical protein
LTGCRDVVLAADGAGLCFLERGGLGLVLAGGESQAGVNLRLDQWLSTISADWQVERVSLGVESAELWRLPGEGGAPIGRLRGSELSALYLGEDLAAVRAGLSGILGRALAGESTASAQRIRSRVRGDAPRLVVDFDLQRLGTWLQEDEPAATPFVEALGFAEPNHVLLDTHVSASGLHEVASWQFGSTTGLSRIMESFQPIEMRQVQTLPAGTTQFSLLRWQPLEFLRSVLELSPSELAQGWQDLRQASQAFLGLDLEQDLLAQLDGQFSVYVGAPPEAGVGDLDPLQGWSLQLGVRDGEAVEEALLKVLEMGEASGALELSSYRDLDVWEFSGEVPAGQVAPRLVFTDRALLLVNGCETLEHALAPFEASAPESLGDGAFQVEQLRARSGAFYFSYQDQAAAMATVLAELNLAAELMGMALEPVSELSVLRTWFPGVMVSSVQHTAGGIELRASVR